MNKTITLNKYDFKAGVNKFFTDADLSFSDFKEERQKDIAEADIVLFEGLGVNDVPLGGKVLKDVHGTSFYTVTKKEMAEARAQDARAQDARAQDARDRWVKSIIWVIIGTLFFFLVINK